MDKEKKQELKAQQKIANHTKPKNMTAEQMSFYKKGKHAAHRNNFWFWFTTNALVLGGLAGGGYLGYNYLVDNYSPKAVEVLKTTLDTTGKYMYNYIYYKSAYSMESGKAEVMSKAIEQMLDKYDELKQQLEDAQNHTTPSQPSQPSQPTNQPQSPLYNFPARELNENEKIASANFVVGLYNNGETNKFDIKSFEWGNTFNLDIATTHENGEHQFSISLAGNEDVMQSGQAVYGTAPVEFNGDLYKKFGAKGLKPALNLIKNVVGGLDTAIYSIGIDGNNVTMEQMTNFFKEEDCIDYLKNAGFDFGIDVDRIEETLNDDSSNTEPTDSTETEEESL